MKKVKTVLLSLNVMSSSKQTTGRITMKRGSSKLYFDFYRKTFRTEITTGLKDTVENRQEAAGILRVILDEIERGEFCFSEAFPSASARHKAFHSQLDTRKSHPSPDKLTVGQYVEGPGGWKERLLETDPKVNRREDYRQAVDNRILPYWRDKSFSEMTGPGLVVYIRQLKWRKTAKEGSPVSASRVLNILIPLRKIWNYAKSQYHWDSLEDPFLFLVKQKELPTRDKKPVRGYSFQSWKKLNAHMDDYYRPVNEIMTLTGMIGSEITGLRKADIDGNVINVCNKWTPREEGDTLKNVFRPRSIPITEAIRTRLDMLLKDSPEDREYVFYMKDGQRFDIKRFTDGPWKTAIRRAKLEYLRPYVTRHCFAAWSMSVRVDINRLEYLMGHASKEMLYEIYGKYSLTLENECDLIVEHFGEDYVRGVKGGSWLNPAASESLSESPRGIGRKGFITI